MAAELGLVIVITITVNGYGHKTIKRIKWLTVMIVMVNGYGHKMGKRIKWLTVMVTKRSSASNAYRLTVKTVI